MKPLAIDLFCGLRRQAQLLGRANLLVEQLVAGGAENPNHVALQVGNNPPSAIALVLRFVRDLHDTGLAARLTRSRHIRTPPPESTENSVLAAKIAKIPFALSSWIARTYKPAAERAA